MILNLEAQEIVDGGHCLGVFAGDSDAGSLWSLFNSVFNLIAQLFHRRHTGWGARMNQHGSVEVAALEHAGDVLQVLANFLSAGSVAIMPAKTRISSMIFASILFSRARLDHYAHAPGAVSES